MDLGQFFGPFMDDYFAECEEHLASLRRLLLDLEAGNGHPALVQEWVRGVFRNLHTLKGLSGMVGFAESEAVAHTLEDLLRGAAPGGLLPNGASLDILFEGVGLLERCLDARRSGASPPDVEQLLAELRAADQQADTSSSAATASAAPHILPGPAGLTLSAAESLRLGEALRRNERAVAFEFVPTPELVARGTGVEAVRGRLGSLGEIIHASPRVLPGRGVAFRFLVTVPVGAEPPEEWRADGITWDTTDVEPGANDVVDAPATQPIGGIAAPGTAVASSSAVRVELARLDELLRLVGEIVISRSRLDDLLRGSRSERAVPVEALEDINSGMELQLRDLREAVMRVRLVAIGEVFERMRFVVRDVTNSAGKDVRVELRGQDTEIDKLVVERIMEPLLHLVRNAVSHGIEAPAEREASGKPLQGRLVLTAAAAGERVRIEVEDDGRGVDRAAVAERASARGLAVPDEVLDDARLLDILCAPGFSTREVADLASGRGVGMDVVRSTIRALGGELVLSSEVGRGTRFTVELPLTLMIVDALLVRVGDQTMAVPQPALLEVVQVEASDVVTFENNEVVRYRHRTLPLLRLRTLFGITGPGEGRSFPMLVVGSEAQPVGLAVDRLAGLREIVVRSLTDPLVAVPGIAAAAELGDGRVCLILDSGELVDLAQQLRMGRRPACKSASTVAAQRR